LKNCFVLNPLKSKFILLGSHGKISKINDHNPGIKLNGTAIEQVTETRSLGILIDNRLKFHNHVVQTVKSCFYRLKVLYQVRKYLDIDTRVRLCETLILSKLNYADVVIGECLFGYTKKLIQRVQNACARYCYYIPRRAHVTPYLNRSHLLNMNSRRLFHFASLLFGIVKQHSPPYLFNKLIFSRRQVRTTSRLICPAHSTAAFRGSFRYSATKCWNNIPPPLKNCGSSQTFKRNFKKHLLELQKS
jgi:hypothetical protein